MKVLFYCRFATMEQATIEEQIQDYSKKKRQDVLGVYKDIDTFKTLNRPGFNGLLEEIDTDKIEAVIIRDIYRISRNPIVNFNLIERLLKHKAKLLCASEQDNSDNEKIIGELSPEKNAILNRKFRK